MNSDNNASKKRKQTSFANDRLKRLRTTLKDEVVKSSSPNIPKLDFTPSVKNNIQNNPTGYPERKKLVAVRKLKNNSNDSHSKFSSQGEKNNSGLIISGMPSLVQNMCSSKVQKEISNSSRSTISTVQNTTPIQRDKKPESFKCSSLPNKNIATNLAANKSSTQNLVNDKIKNTESQVQRTSGSFDVKTPKKHSQHLVTTNNNSANSRLAKLRNDDSTFPNIASTKTEFKYQHVPNLQTSQVNRKFTANDRGCSSGISKDYNEYFGEAMISLYNKLFSSNQNAIKTVHENEDVGADSMDWEPGVLDSSPHILELIGTKKSDREMYIIVDTNIFLDSLGILEGIVKFGSNKGVRPVIYVPWMVFNELDFIKDNRSSGLQSKASKAIDFVNKMLLNKEGKLIGQSIYEANNQMYVGKSPDDKITSCCLQVKEKGFNTVLLSNDKNLRNKLMVNGVPSLSCSDLMKNFDSASPHSDRIETLLDKMSTCCTIIITDCCIEAYGPVYNKLALLDKQPWSFKDCLEVFKKYWSAVFRDKFLKQFLKSVEKILSNLKSLGSLKNPTTFEEFAKDCLSLCFFFTDLEKHKKLITDTTKEINVMVGLKSS